MRPTFFANRSAYVAPSIVPYDLPRKFNFCSPRAERRTSMSFATSSVLTWPSSGPAFFLHASASFLSPASSAFCSLLSSGEGSEPMN